LEGKHPKCWGQVRSSALCHTVMHTQFDSVSQLSAMTTLKLNFSDLATRRKI
jgi:hypothetical protein